MLYLLLSVIIVGGMFSSPFPVAYGVQEAYIGIGLMIFSFNSLRFLLRGIGTGSMLIYFSFIWLVCIPTLMAIVNQNTISNYVRDIVPLMYIFLPLILLPYIERKAGHRHVIMIGTAMYIAGVAISWRYILAQNTPISEFGHAYQIVDFTLAYDPLVSFVSIVGISLALTLLMSRRKYKLLLASSIAIVSLTSLIPPIGVVQRVPLVMISLSLILYVFIKGKDRPVLYFYSTVLMVFVLFGYWDVLSGAVLQMIEKTSVHGINGKVYELLRIIEVMSGSVGNLLFGIGWGGVYYNEVLNGDVRFTHSIITFILLKTGVLGFMIFFVYIIWFMDKLIKTSVFCYKYKKEWLPVCFYMYTVLLISLFQPIYKTLSFGLSMMFILFIFHAFNVNKKHSKKVSILNKGSQNA